MSKFEIKKRSRDLLLLASWLVGMFFMPSTAWAGCVTTPNSLYPILVDASSSCSALGMQGCATDGSGNCVIPNPISGQPAIVIQVSPSDAVGSIPQPPGLVSWQVLSGPPAIAGKEVDFAISLGATGGGTCGWNYAPGKDWDTGLGFLKNNGSYQKVNGFFLCSDFSAPPPEVPRLVLQKTVMPAGGICGVDDVENLEINVGDDAEYCFLVENVGIGEASNVTLSDPAIFASDLIIGNLAPGGSVLIPRDPADDTLVNIDSQGEIVNTATVSGDATDNPSFPVPDASDTATVNAILVAEACPEDFQDDINDLATSTGLDYAFLLDPQKGGRTAVCTPDGTSGTVPAARRIPCIDQCVTKPECQVDPSDPACSPSVCEPSGAWTEGDEFACTDLYPQPDALPYCWEIQQDFNRDCVANVVDPLEETVLTIKKSRMNPYYYQSCYNSGGRYVCETMCFPLFAGDVCP